MSRNQSLRYVLAVLIFAAFFLSSCTKGKPGETEQTVETSADVVASATDYTQVVASAVPVEIRPLRDRVIGSERSRTTKVSIKARTSGEIEVCTGIWEPPDQR
jgi:membrane fusion protein (multidrug efflux system)